MSQRISERTAFFIIGAACLLVFGSSLGFGYVELDDPKHIFENPAILVGSLSHALQFWQHGFFGLYIPLVYSVWTVVAALGHSPWTFHLLNVSLHVIASFLAFTLLEDLLEGRRDLALIGALCFALHPVQVESVCWISSGKDLLAGVFCLAALKSLWRGRMFLATGLFGAALLSKPSSCFLPLMAAALLWLRPSLFASAVKTKFCLIVWGVSALPVMAITCSLQSGVAPEAVLPVLARLGIAADALTFYLAKLIFPYPLLVDYSHSPVTVLFDFWFVTKTILLIGLFSAISLRRGRALEKTALLLFLCPLLPVLGIVPFQFQKFSTVADHYLYLSALGFALGVARLCSLIAARRMQVGLVVGLVFLMGGVSLRQARVWQNSVSLFEHNIRYNRRSLIAETNLSYALAKDGRMQAALFHMRRSVAIAPQEMALRVALDRVEAGWGGDYRTQTRLRP